VWVIEPAGERRCVLKQNKVFKLYDFEERCGYVGGVRDEQCTSLSNCGTAQ